MTGIDTSAEAVKQQTRVRFGVGKAVIPYTLAFLCFFVPADYAVSEMLGDAWKATSLAAGAFFTLLLLCRKGIDAKFSFFFLFSLSFHALSSAVAGSDAGIATVIHYSVKLIGFFGLCAYGLQRNGRYCLLGFIAAGVIMCTANYVTYLQYGDIVGGMRYGVISFKGTLTTQHCFF